MEIRNIDVELKKDNEKDVMVFKLPTEQKIDLNSEDQSYLREVFYSLLTIMFTEKVVLKLIYNEDYKELLFINIAGEYIKQLNNEISKIYQSMNEDLATATKE